VFIAIYNDMGGLSRRWRAIKRWYVSSNRACRWLLLLTLWSALHLKAAAGRISRLQTPITPGNRSNYKRDRGMSAWHDFVDWVGGYPYETAKPEQIFDFYRGHGFTLDFLRTGGLGCNEFVFTAAEESHWHSEAISVSEVRLMRWNSGCRIR
jgi:2-polyprenyl-6-hydroxyphenyl methylase/3-demethylubiquinone-9 3-methyltransferase